MTIDAFEDRQPCPVCDHPTGDCGPEGDHPPHVLFEEWGEGYKAPDERKTTMADVVATERIWERVPIPRTKDRTRKVLRFAAGSIVPEEDAKRLNVKADGTQSKVPLAETDESGTVPLSDPPKAAAKAAPTKKAAAKKAAAKKAGTAKKAAAKKA